jgi:hypothetical protein
MYTRRRIRTLPSRLHPGEPIDSRGHVSVLARFRLELEADRERARLFASRFERFGQLEQHLVAVV